MMQFVVSILMVASVLPSVLSIPVEESFQIAKEEASAQEAVRAAERNVNIISRAGWGARAATGVANMATPVPFVVVHHSFQPAACFTQANCAAAMRTMQNHHQLTNGWNDIGYSFGIGSDGQAYEGRGWNAQGAHAPGYNARSIGIVVIGDWRTQIPSQATFNALQNLIALGVARGSIAANHRIVGHRQVTATECPGNALFNALSRFPRFDPNY